VIWLQIRPVAHITGSSPCSSRADAADILKGFPVATLGTIILGLPNLLGLLTSTLTTGPVLIRDAEADTQAAWEQIQPKLAKFKTDLAKLEAETGGVTAKVTDVEGLGESVVVLEGSKVWVDVEPIITPLTNELKQLIGSAPAATKAA
jgi:hypothetical protein